ncbi:MAG TPA: RNA-guided endonuclease TnpB family protein [Streptosporangiaceae bacterium]
MRTAYRCRAYPDQQQQAVLTRTFGCIRVVWNRTLAARHARWQHQREGTSYAQTDAALTAMKREQDLAFLSEVSSVSLQQALRHQHHAFRAFFARRARHPRFKSRRSRQSAHYTRSAFSMRGGELRLAKTSAPLRFVWSWPDVDVTSLNPTMVVVSREPDGRWYVTFAIDADAPEPLEPAGHAVGVDLGVKDFAVTSDGERIANPRHLERKAANLARYQRRLARCRKGSANRAKARAKVARAHRKVRDARRDFLHRASTRLVRGNDVIVIDRWYPSSKTCSACGYLLGELSLSTRHWTCPSCGSRHDRDINAAKNILAAGQAVTACGAGVRHSGTSRVRPAVK